jgi:flagellar operon protein (TIGR03826 family)
MSLRNCPECGRVFTFVRTNLCPACQDKDEEQYKIVRNYITRNRGSDIRTVSEATGVSEEKIIRYVREGRIVNADAAVKIKLQCELCGKLIPRGRYCEGCADKLTSGLKRAISEENRKAREEERQKNASRMHTADHWRKR